jgi:subfamily B ATP-binding cassette protein MsbA
MSPLRRLFGYLRPYRGRTVAVVGLATFTAFCAFGTIGSVKPLFDTLFAEDGNAKLLEGLREWGGPGVWLADLLQPMLGGEPIRALTAIILVIIALRLVGGVARFLQEAIGGTLGQRVMVDVSCDLHDHTVRQSPGYLAGLGVGDAISRFNADVESLGTGIRTLFQVIVPEPLKFLFSLGLAFLVSWKLTLLVVVLFPLSFFLIRTLGRRVKSAGRRVLEKRAVILRMLQDTLFGLPVVQVYGGEREASRRFRKTNERVLASWRKVIRTQAATSPAVEMIGVLGGSAALVAAGHLVLGGHMSPGSFVLFYVAVFSLYEPIRKLAATVNRLQLAAAGAGRIFDLMDHPPDIRDRSDATALPRHDRDLELVGVSYAYAGRSPALRDVSVRIPAGATVALVGASGAGKSTLASLIPRLIDPDEGRVLVDGHDLRDVTLASLRGQIALVPQETTLFSDSIAANIAFARPDATSDQVRAAARAAHVVEFAETLPEGLDTWIGEGGRGLSGGQRQRVALARALLRDPRIVLLDEATSALDPESEQLLEASLTRFLAGRTAVVIAHHARGLRLADLVLVLDEGRVECFGTLEACRGESAVLRSILTTRPPSGGGR